MITQVSLTFGTEWDTIYKTMKEDLVTRDILNKIRILKEENERQNDAIAITDDPRFGEAVLSNQIEQFRSSVESGAQFNKPEQGKVEEAPLIYMPSTSNLVFSGTIPCLNNLKWQFVLKTNTGNGCFVWSDGLILSDENMRILQKLYGFYVNWRNSWNAESRDLEMLNTMFNKQ